jgi:hypothetical protein
MKKNTNYILPVSVFVLVVLYTFMYEPKKKESEGYCGMCGKK